MDRFSSDILSFIVLLCAGDVNIISTLVEERAKKLYRSIEGAVFKRFHPVTFPTSTFLDDPKKASTAQFRDKCFPDTQRR